MPDPNQVNILIVDDLPEKHVVMGSILEELGQNLVSARSGREALRLILQMEFAVILLDVNMPDIDGLETASLIRQYKKTAQTPILFITAYVDEMQASKAMRWARWTTSRRLSCPACCAPRSRCLSSCTA
jgi:CheY-like chemotaxis protein